MLDMNDVGTVLRPWRLFLVSLIAAFAAMPACHGGELRAAPWPRPAPSSDAASIDIFYFRPLDEADLPAIEDIAEQGNAWAAVAAAHHYENERDGRRAAHWRRRAVQLGHVESAFELAQLYFPLDGTLGREDLLVRPDIVTAICWLTIGLAGLPEENEDDAEEFRGRPSREHATEELAALASFLLPSERARAEAILAAWPDSLPPEGSLDPILPNTTGPRMDKDEFIARLYDMLNENSTGETGLSFRRDGMEKLSRAAYAAIEADASAGDEEARYAAAWCRLFGVGTEKNGEEALAFIRARADAGEARACFHLARYYAYTDKDGETDSLCLKAAQSGRVDAMLFLALRLREQEKRGEAATWTEKAAETGNLTAIAEMLSVAESNRDIPGMIRWLTVLSLRWPDPGAAYRARIMLAFFIDEITPAEMTSAMEAGERWHLDHP